MNTYKIKWATYPVVGLTFYSGTIKIASPSMEEAIDKTRVNLSRHLNRSKDHIVIKSVAVSK